MAEIQAKQTASEIPICPVSHGFEAMENVCDTSCGKK